MHGAGHLGMLCICLAHLHEVVVVAPCGAWRVVNLLLLRHIHLHWQDSHISWHVHALEIDLTPSSHLSTTSGRNHCDISR